MEWQRLFKAAVNNYAKARGLDITKMRWDGHLLMRNDGDVSLQRCHRDYTIDTCPMIADCERAKKQQRERIAALNSGSTSGVKQEDDKEEIIEISE